MMNVNITAITAGIPKKKTTAMTSSITPMAILLKKNLESCLYKTTFCAN